MNMRKVCGMVLGISAVAISSLSVLHAQHQHAAPPDAAKDVSGELPGVVAKLVPWPTTDQRAGKVVEPNASNWAIRANRNSIEWIQKVIDPKWLPNDLEGSLSLKPVLLEKAYDRLDTSHVEWEKNGYHFRVSQTMTVFYLSVTPTQGKIVEGDLAAKREGSREFVSKLVKDIAEVEVPLSAGKVNIAAEGTKKILMRSSFETANVRQFDSGIMAQPANPDPRSELNRARSDFWWYRMGWWTDGQTVGLFTLKTEGGAWLANYGSRLDEHWLSPSPSEWNR